MRREEEAGREGRELTGGLNCSKKKRDGSAVRCREVLHTGQGSAPVNIKVLTSLSTVHTSDQPWTNLRVERGGGEVNAPLTLTSVPLTRR